MTKRILGGQVFLAYVFFVLCTANIFGQVVSGDLTGSVLDPMGMSIPSAQVSVTNQDTGVKTTGTAGPDGVYHFSNLLPGNYTLNASASGFAPGAMKNIAVVLNATVTANLALSVGSTSTTVEVTEAPPSIDTSTSQLTTTFETVEIQDMPISMLSRSAGVSNTVQSAAIWNLRLLGAGVASNGGVGQGTGPTIAGQRPENNTFFLDGVSDNNHYSTGPLAVVANEAVAEVSLLQNQFSPEFGGASGGIFNAVVKSGTKQIHGSIYEYFQNRDLNAVDALDWTVRRKYLVSALRQQPAWVRPSAARLLRTSFSISGISNTTRLASRPPRQRRFRRRQRPAMRC